MMMMRMMGVRMMMRRKRMRKRRRSKRTFVILVFVPSGSRVRLSVFFNTFLIFLSDFEGDLHSLRTKGSINISRRSDIYFVPLLLLDQQKNVSVYLMIPRSYSFQRIDVEVRNPNLVLVFKMNRSTQVRIYRDQLVLVNQCEKMFYNSSSFTLNYTI